MFRWSVFLVCLLLVVFLLSNLASAQDIGNDEIQLTDSDDREIAAAWSPDGQWIAFTLFNWDEDTEAYIMKVDGTEIIQLTDNDVQDAPNSWSPDGTRLTVVSEQDGDFEIYTMNASGTDVVQLTHNDAWDYVSIWSPDGQRIAFSSDRDGDFDIYTMRADGSDVIQLTNDPGQDFPGSWSPDGQRIAFTSDRDGDSEIFTMRADGSDVIQLTHTDANDNAPDWSPDGQWIAFTSDRDGNSELYVMRPDGSSQIRLTLNDSGDYSPLWSPDGQWLLYSSSRSNTINLYLKNMVDVRVELDAEAGIDQTADAVPTVGAVTAAAAEPGPVTSNADWDPITEEFDGVEMVLVPPGCFMMGSDGHYDRFSIVGEDPAHEICFDEPFWIDKYEVTNQQFTELGGVAEVRSQRRGARLPATSITWFEALDFCRSRNATLPTEAEWEYAARGPSSLVFPWGNSFNADNVVYRENSGNLAAEVGSKPGGASWVGALDMSGNVYEWLTTIMGIAEEGNTAFLISFFYPYTADDGREVINDDPLTGRGSRGGYFNSVEITVRASARYGVIAGYVSDAQGFRCVRPYSP